MSLNLVFPFRRSAASVERLDQVEQERQINRQFSRVLRKVSALRRQRPMSLSVIEALLDRLLAG